VTTGRALRLARGGRAVQDDHFMRFTFPDTPKVWKIRIFQKKSNMSELVRVEVGFF